jgi:hypothetical protein
MACVSYQILFNDDARGQRPHRRGDRLVDGPSGETAVNLLGSGDPLRDAVVQVVAEHNDHRRGGERSVVVGDVVVVGQVSLSVSDEGFSTAVLDPP